MNSKRDSIGWNEREPLPIEHSVWLRIKGVTKTFITANEAAALYGCSSRHFRRIAQVHKLRRVDFSVNGGRDRHGNAKTRSDSVRFLVAEVEQLKREHPWMPDSRHRKKTGA